MKYSVNKENSNMLDMPGRFINVFVGSRKLSSDNFTMGLTEVHPSTEMTPHVHSDSEEVIFVVEGTGEAIVGGSHEPLEPYTAVVFPPGVEHQVINKNDKPLKFVFAFNVPHFFDELINKAEK